MKYHFAFNIFGFNCLGWTIDRLLSQSNPDVKTLLMHFLSDMPYASIFTNVLQSKEEDNELVRDEEATKHEIVQDTIKIKFQMYGSGWASQVFFST